MELRIVTSADVLASTDLLSLRVVCAGSAEECATFARANGYRWRTNPVQLHKGYWVDANGDCLLPS